MNCKQALSLLADYYDQKLTDGQVRELKAHLKTCPSCSSTLSALKNIRKFVEYERLVYQHKDISIVTTVVVFFRQGFVWVKQALIHSPAETIK